MPVTKRRDWEHQAQSSEQRPDLALMMPQICELDRCLFGGCHERLRGIRAQFQSLFPSRHAFQRSDGKVQAGVFFGYRFHCLLLILEFSCVAVRN